jgi:hypothetical protein
MKKIYTLFLTLFSVVAPLLSQFIENQGQVVDVKGEIQPNVLFTVESDQSRMFFERNKIVFALHEISFVENEKSRELAEKGNSEGAKEAAMKIKTQRIDLDFVDANPFPEVIFEKKRKEFQNFYLGHCPQGITNVSMYDEVIYKDLYPNVDIVFYAHGGQVKYDVVLHAGAKLSDVKFRYNGVNTLTKRDHHLLASTEIFPMVEKMPVSYWQANGEKVDAQFKLGMNNEFGFEIEGIDEVAETLVIDPILTWATLLQRSSGGSSGIRGNVVTDEVGNFFHQINTYVADMPIVNPGGVVYLDPTYNPSGFGLDVYFAKFDVNRNMVWSTYLGGTGTQNNFYDHGIRSKNGVFYVCGKTESTDFPTLNQGAGAYFELSPGSGSKGFLSKFNSATGQMLHSTYLRCFDYLSMDVDENGNVAVSSFNYTWSHAPTVLNRAGAYNQATHAGNSDIFLYMFDENMIQTWGTFVGGTGYEEPMGVKFDNAGSLYLFNRSDAATVPLVNPGGGAFYNATYYDKYDYWFVKFDADGEMVWSTLYGGMGLEGLSYSQVEVNSNNDVIFTSTTRSTSMPTLDPGNDAYFQTTPAGLTDGWGGSGTCSGFIVRFDENGVLLHGTYMGSDNEENYIQGQSKGNNGEHYLMLQSRTFNTTPLTGAYNVNNADPTQYGYLVMQMSPNFEINWSSYVHQDSCFMERMVTDLNNGRLYVTGTTRARFFPFTDPGSGAFYDDQWNSGANLAWAIMEFQICSTPDQPASITGATEFCDASEQTYTVPNDSDADSYTWTFPSGWTGSSTTNSITVNTDNNSGQISVVANNSCGASSAQILNITVNNSNAATIEETACKFYVSPLGVTYTSSQQIVEVLTNVANCDSTLTIDLTIVAPDVTTSVNGMTAMANATGVTYQWLDCDNDFAVIPGAINQNFTANLDGNYAVEVTLNGCVDTSACVLLSTASLGNLNADLISIYPNPSSGQYIVSGVQAGSQIAVYSASGQLILRKSIHNSSDFEINISNVESGIYFLEISNDTGMVKKKLTKI